MAQEDADVVQRHSREGELPIQHPGDVVIAYQQVPRLVVGVQQTGLAAERFPSIQDTMFQGVGASGSECRTLATGTRAPTSRASAASRRHALGSAENTRRTTGWERVDRRSR